MRLWDKGEALNQRIHAFTVGDEPQTDLNLVRWDAIGSAAHAKVLFEAGILTKDELAQLLPALKEIIELSDQGKFQIKMEQEDCHTAIEEFLTQKLGEPGRKIHTGRSRNDQVMTAMRLFLRAEILKIRSAVLDLAESFVERYKQVGQVPMPGYTHLQLAMPSSVQMWLHAFMEGCIELAYDGQQLFDNVNLNPSEVASGFSVPLNLSRQRSTEILGFSRLQRSPINVISSRGKHELKAARWASDIATILERFAWDFVLYATKEFGFFGLPAEFTTGSSIMPQKRNPDVLELMRGRAAKVRAAEQEIMLVTAKLPSNYHREFQYTKAPCIRALSDAELLLSITPELVRSFTINQAKLEAAMAPELYATYDVYRSVRAGKTFREAYQETAKRCSSDKIDVAVLKEDFNVIAKQVEGEFQLGVKELAKMKTQLAAEQSKIIELERLVLIP